MIGAFALRCVVFSSAERYHILFAREVPASVRIAAEVLSCFLVVGIWNFDSIIPPKVTFGWYLVVRIPDSPSL